MPTFRQTPSRSLGDSIRKAIQSSGGENNPLVEIQADMAAAQTAQHLGLAEKARAEVEAMRRSEADRASPAVATEYASRSSGLTDPEGTRLSNHLRGVLEQPSSNDDLDASIRGQAAQSFATEAPNITAGQKRGFETAPASTIANRLATGKTNAEQLAHAGGRLNETAVTNEATDATNVPDANRLISAVAKKVREPFKTNAQGTVLNEETGALNEAGPLAAAVRRNLDAQAGQRNAAAGAGAVSDTPTPNLPKGAELFQEADSGTKYAYNKNMGRAWKATDKGWEQILITALPKNIAKVGAGGATQGNREAVFTQRVVTSANQAAHDLENVVKLPLTASTGVFGGRKQGPGLFDATKEVLANKMTSQEAQSYNVMSTGFQRSLAAIESAGLMPSGALTHQMDAVLFKEGDTNLTKLHKLAQTRQIVESGMEVMNDNPRISEMEKGRIRKVLESITKAVPFTHQDLIALQQAQEIDPNTTLKDVISKVAKGGGPQPKNAKGWNLMTDAKGNKAYVSPDGKEFEEVK